MSRPGQLAHGRPAGGPTTQFADQFREIDREIRELRAMVTKAASATARNATPLALVDSNVSPITVSSGLVTLNQIPIGLGALGTGSGVVGANIDGTATGTGTLTVTFYYGTAQIGPTVNYAFTAGPVHIAVPDSIAGITTSATLSAKAQVTSGTGTVAFGIGACHLYIFATGITSSSNIAPLVTVTDTVTYQVAFTSTPDTAATSLLTPLTAGPVESVVTTPTVTADGGVITTALSCRGTSTTTATAATSLNVTIPAATVIGDQMYVAIGTSGTATHTIPAGWTLVRSDTGAGTTAVRLSVFSRTAVSGDPGAALSFAVSASSSIVAGAYVVGGSATLTPDTTGATGSGADASTAVAPSVTTTVAGDWLLEVFVAAAASGTTEAITAPQSRRAAVSHPTVGLALAFADQQAAASVGATATQTATLSVAGSSVATSLAIAP